MIEGIIIFIVGFICGKYTNQVKDFCIKMYNKFTKKEVEE